MSLAEPEVDVDLSTITHLDFDHEVPCDAPKDDLLHRAGARAATHRLAVRGCSCVYLLCNEHAQWALGAASATGVVCRCPRTVGRQDIDIAPLKT